MAYVKSVLWLLGTGALGYTLLLVTAPDDKAIAEKYPDARSVDARNTHQAIVDTLRLAAENQKPMYRQSGPEIERDMRGASSRQH